MLESERVLYESYPDQREEGKSLMEDFNNSNRSLNMRDPESNFPVIRNVIQENSKEEENLMEEVDLPALISVQSHNSNSECQEPSKRSKMSKISKMNEHNPHDLNSIISQNNDSLRGFEGSVSRFQKSSSKFHASQNHLNYQSVSKKSSPRVLQPKIDNMFEKDIENNQFMDKVYPFQENFSQE